jgi:SAM-dependent methyltransferase
MLQNVFRTASDHSRRRKIDLFYNLMRPGRDALVLDVGGEAGDPAGNSFKPSRQLLDSYPHPSRVLLVNLSLPVVQRSRRMAPGVKAVCATGLRLPLADKSVDVCYCNAVIEHLFSHDNQVAFANEIMRVARNWFVTTPNRWFPFEPHLRLPLVTWLPQHWQHKLGYRFGYLHLERRYGSGADRRDLRLLSRWQLQRLFPGSRVRGIGVPGFTPTFVVYGGEVLAAPAASGNGNGRLRPPARDDEPLGEIAATGR